MGEGKRRRLKGERGREDRKRRRTGGRREWREEGKAGEEGRETGRQATWDSMSA